MSKFLKVDGDYKVSVSEGGTITLDTGLEQGTVVITGDLVVQGDQTEIESETLVIKDNIIVVNQGEQGNGVTLGQAGLRVERGNYPDALFVWDEDILWNNPLNQVFQRGAFTFLDTDGGIMGIKTVSIATGGTDLYLINQGAGVVSVSGTVDYETNVTDDDDIPNKKYVDDQIIAFLTSISAPRIGDGTVTQTYVLTADEENTGVPSLIEFAIDNNIVAEFYNDRLELNDLRISGTTISTTASNEDLILSAPGTGSVLVNDTLEITRTPGIDDTILAPDVPLDGMKLYVNEPQEGGTGLFFVNDSTNRDEIVSRNRSLLFSMLF